MKKLAALLRDRSGATAGQYALILAITGAAVAVAAMIVGGAIKDSASDSASCIRAAAQCAPSQVDATPT